MVEIEERIEISKWREKMDAQLDHRNAALGGDRFARKTMIANACAFCTQVRGNQKHVFHFLNDVMMLTP